MNRYLLVTGLALFMVMAVGAQSQKSVEQEILKLENDWSTAWQKKDATFLQKLFADEYLSTDQDGNTFTKSQELANLALAGTATTSFALSDMKVHVYGDVALVTGRNTIKATYKGNDTSGAYRFTDVIVKRDGRWQVVATHGSMVSVK